MAVVMVPYCGAEIAIFQTRSHLRKAKVNRWEKEKVEEKTRYFRLYYTVDNSKKKIFKKQYMHRIFVINVKAWLVPSAECRKALVFTARGSNSPDFLPGRM